MMSIHVLKSGLLTTVQDLGRIGFQQYGVVAGGAMDSFALQTANVLVGNDPSAAGLEITMLGPTLEFTSRHLVSICGSDVSATIDGIPVPQWRPVLIERGSRLQIGSVKSGSRCYVAIAGGLDVPVTMNSRSTYLRAGIGGFRGRPLQAGDELDALQAEALSERIAMQLRRQPCMGPFAAALWQITTHMLPAYRPDPVVRVIEGMQHDLFTRESLSAFAASGFRVLPQSDRMGYRLAGPELQVKRRTELISEAVTFGTVQVPPDGHPIVLMADRQTTGGYPKIAQVISADLPLLAQLPIGGLVRFRFITLQEAQQLSLLRMMELEQLQLSIRIRCI